MHLERVIALWCCVVGVAGCEPARADHEGAAPSASPTHAVVAASASASANSSAPVLPKRCAPACSSLERCDAATGRCRPACPTGEVFVPATGEKGFVMGAHLSGHMDVPHRVVLTRPFCMDATEVTVRAYKSCVDAGSCEKPQPWGIWRNYPTLLDHPVNKVDWKHAKVYCEAQRKSLPTEAQWEWAATGGDGRRWPWGNERPTCKHGDLTPGILEGPASDDGCHGGGTSPVGTHPDGDRIWPSGRIHDLAGNVWEWVLDNFQAYPGVSEVDPLHMRVADGVHVLRGGGWNRSGAGVRTQFRGGAVVDYRVPGVGFRCVRNPKPDSPSLDSPPVTSTAAQSPSSSPR